MQNLRATTGRPYDYLFDTLRQGHTSTLLMVWRIVKFSEIAFWDLSAKNGPRLSPGAKLGFRDVILV